LWNFKECGFRFSDDRNTQIEDRKNRTLHTKRDLPARLLMVGLGNLGFTRVEFR
jgi:hypothetical protein